MPFIAEAVPCGQLATALDVNPVCGTDGTPDTAVPKPLLHLQLNHAGVNPPRVRGRARERDTMQCELSGVCLLRGWSPHQRKESALWLQQSSRS